MKYTIADLIDRQNNGEQLDFLFFYKEDPFNQWGKTPFVIGDVEYKTAEHWMMIQKARLFFDFESEQKMLQTNHPRDVKELGRQVKNFSEQTWDQHKYDIVKRGNIAKFSNQKYREVLLNTGNLILVEASPQDTIWGIGLDAKTPNITLVKNWKGTNLLGFALMEVRDFYSKFNFKHHFVIT